MTINPNVSDHMVQHRTQQTHTLQGLPTADKRLKPTLAGSVPCIASAQGLAHRVIKLPLARLAPSATAPASASACPPSPSRCNAASLAGLGLLLNRRDS